MTDILRPAELPENKTVLNRRFVEVRPQSDCTGTNFAGNINFNFTISGYDRLVPNKAYFYVKYNSTVGGAATPMNGAYSASTLQMSTLFNNVSHRLNNTLIDNVSDTPQVEMYVKRLSTDKSYKETIGTAEIFEVANKECTLKVNNDIVWFPRCLSMFSQDKPIYATSNHQISFSVDKDYKQRMLKGTTAYYWAHATPANNYTINIKDFVMYLCLEETTELTKGEIAYDCISSEVYMGSAIQNFFKSYTVKPSTIRAGMAVQSSLSGNGLPGCLGGVVPPTIFKSAENDHQEKIIGVRCKYGSRMYPEGDYIPELSATTNYVRRHYVDSYLNEDLHLVGSYESMTDYGTTYGPLYSFDFTKASNDRNTNLDLTVKFSAAPADCNILLFTQYRKVIICKYNDNSEITEVFISDN